MGDPLAGKGPGELLRFASGETVRILVDSRTSDGAFAILDCTHVAGPTEPHVHRDAHKSVFVLSGRYRFVVDDAVFEAGPGDNVFIARGMPHEFVVGVDGGRALFVFSPGGIENYFRTLAITAEDDSSADAIDALKRHYHIAPTDSAPAVEP